MKGIMVHPFYCGVLTRGEAEGLLNGCPVGTFLFRSSRSISSFAYSFVGQERVYQPPLML